MMYLIFTSVASDIESPIDGVDIVQEVVKHHPGVATTEERPSSDNGRVPERPFVCAIDDKAFCSMQAGNGRQNAPNAVAQSKLRDALNKAPAIFFHANGILSLKLLILIIDMSASVQVIRGLLENNEPLSIIVEEIESWEDLTEQNACALLPFLLKHACQNEETETDYATYSYVITLLAKNPSNNSIFAALLRFLMVLCYKNEIASSHFSFAIPFNDLQQILSLIAMGVTTCVELLSDEKAVENFTEEQIYDLCHFIPILLETSLDNLNHQLAVDVLSVITKMIRLIITTEELELDISDAFGDSTAYFLLIDLLRLERATTALSDTIYDTISTLIEAEFEMNIPQNTELYPLTNALSADPKLSVGKFRALVNLSILLMDNGIRAPWTDTLSRSLNDYADHMSAEEKSTLYALRDKLYDMFPALKSDNGLFGIEIPSFNVEEALEKLFECKSCKEAEPFIRELKNRLLPPYNQEDISKVCKPWKKNIVGYVLRMLVVDPAVAEGVTQLFNHTTQTFLDANIQYAVPYAVMYSDDDVLHNLAACSNVRTTDLCSQNAHLVLSALFMEQDRTVRENGYRRLQELFGDRKVIQKLADANFILITANLAIQLGCPELEASVLNALHELDTISGRNMNSTAAIVSSSRFTALLNRVSQHFILQKRNGTSNSEVPDPFALRSLRSLLLILGEEVADHATYLMKIFDDIASISGMQEEALLLWTTFIEQLGRDALSTNIHSIVDGLLNVARVSGASICDQIEDILRKIIVSEDLSDECYQLLPTIPDIEELDSIRLFVEAKRNPYMDTGRGGINVQQLQDHMNNIIATLDAYEDNQVLSGLERLSTLLDEYKKSLTKTHKDELYGKLYHLIKKYSNHAKITYDAAVCLGKLGAHNPSDVDMTITDDRVFVMNRFQSEEENWDFICDLIQNHIYPVYHAAAKEEMKVRQLIEYTIQTLLQQNIPGVLTSTSLRQQQQQTVKAFQRFPRSLQEFLKPLLESDYHFVYKKADEPAERPIFTPKHDYQHWLRVWYMDLIHSATGTAKKIFSACIPIVDANITSVTAYLLPYLVLHTVVSSRAEVIKDVVEELKAVFEASSQEALPQGTVAVGIVDYCQKWMREVRRCDRERRRQVDVDEVKSFLRRIPSIRIAKAAFTGGVYEQALMYFELYLSERQGDPYNVDNRKREVSEIFDYLRVIYQETGNTTDLHELLHSYGNLTYRPTATKCFESLGKWEEAAALHKNEILSGPSDVYSHLAYMESLRMGSQYDVLLNVSQTTCRRFELVPHVNSYRIDAAWRAEEWDLLDQAVHQPKRRDFKSLVGCILNYMRKSQSRNALITVGEARNHLIEDFKRNSVTYQKSYPTLFNLQLLQELEDSQRIWESEQPIGWMDHVVSDWKELRRQLNPNGPYREQLLQIRKAALFDIRPSDSDEEKENEKVYLKSLVLLDMAKNYRKIGNKIAALGALNRANELVYNAHETAKWLWSNNLTKEAIRLVETEVEKHPDANYSLLLFELWDDDPQRFQHGVAKDCIKRVDRLSSNKREKGYYLVLKYYKSKCGDVNTASSVTSLARYLQIQFTLVNVACKALSIGSKYYYYTMSTFINSWFRMMQLEETANRYSQDRQQLIHQQVAQLMRYIDKTLDNIPTYHFISYLTRIISRLSTNNLKMAGWLKRIVYRLLESYPRHTIWIILGALDSQSSRISAAIKEVIAQVSNQHRESELPNIIKQAIKTKDRLKKLSDYDAIDKRASSLDLNRIGSSGALALLTDLPLYLPKENAMIPQLPEVIERNKPADVYPTSGIPTIQKFDKDVLVMKSLQRPKRIAMHGSDGKKYYFLLKKEDDLRKDARTMEFENMLNDTFKKNRVSQDKGLYIRTFAVIPLGFDWGLLEWIENLESLKSIVNSFWEASGKPSVQMVSARMNNTKLETPEQKFEFFKKSLMPQCPSVFYKWFFERFPEPTQWLESRTRYIKTLAVMSIVGHVIGLGDRHAENILFDNTNGDCVHVDLNMIFDRGAKLPVPEIVPFRLTHNLITAMGPLGVDGLFTETCEATLRVLLENKESLINVFETYVDEILAVDATSTAPLKVRKIEEKLRNERIADVVQKLIKNASNPANLAQMFPGWAPFV